MPTPSNVENLHAQGTLVPRIFRVASRARTLVLPTAGAASFLLANLAWRTELTTVGGRAFFEKIFFVPLFSSIGLAFLILVFGQLSAAVTKRPIEAVFNDPSSIFSVLGQLALGICFGLVGWVGGIAVSLFVLR